MNGLRCLAEFIRWQNWGPAKLPFLLAACFYAGLANRPVSPSYVRDGLLFALLAAASSIYGYLVNDLGDIEIDRLQGKRNAFATWPRPWASACVLLLALIGLVLVLPLAHKPSFLVLWLLWLAASTCYSLPPLRLKERGVLGLAVPAIAQQALPVLLAFAVVSDLSGPAPWLWAACATSKGLSLILLHQRQDLEGDKTTGTHTFAVQRGERIVNRAAFVALEADKVLLWPLLILMLLAAPTVRLANSSVAATLPLVVLYLPIHVASIVEGWLDWRRGIIRDPYAGPIQDATGLACVVWPAMIVPLYLAAVLVAVHPHTWLLLGLIVAIHLSWAPKIIQRLHHLRPILDDLSPGSRAENGLG
ncbi:MAG: UbiA family prenyltransferase [Anaerolineae bacterium]|nr:UbiA family prenyltransferase [Anaerolineae bacterium]